MSEMEELFELVKNDKTIRSAFLSSLNSMAQIATGHDEDFDKMKQKYESWQELDMAGDYIKDAIEKNESFQNYLNLGKKVAGRLMRASLGSLV
jgi:hypothetical protein